MTLSPTAVMHKLKFKTEPIKRVIKISETARATTLHGHILFTFIICLHWYVMVKNKLFWEQDFDWNILSNIISEYPGLKCFQVNVKLHKWVGHKEVMVGSIGLDHMEASRFFSFKYSLCRMIITATLWNMNHLQKPHWLAPHQLSKCSLIFGTDRFCVFSWVLTSWADRAFHCDELQLQQVLLTHTHASW